MTPEQVASDITAFTSQHVEPWRRKAAQEHLLHLHTTWTRDARDKCSSGIVEVLSKWGIRNEPSVVIEPVASGEGVG